MLLIENGFLIDPATGTEGYYDVLTEGDKVVKIGKELRTGLSETKRKDCRIIDAKGLTVAPGLVDVHVHFRDPGFTHKEDIFTGAKAAAAGGFTTVVLMCNTKPCVDNKETLSYIIEKGKQTDIHVETCANVTMGMKGQEMVPMEELAGLGAVGFTDDGIPIMDPQMVRRAFLRAAGLDMPVSLHEEDASLISNNGINARVAKEHFGIGGSPREAEISLVARDLEIALETGVCLNVQHISTKEAVELVRQAKKKGSGIHAEATPHHFTLTDEAVLRYGTLAKMNPPLREEADREAIIEGLKDGTIDLIATDHAPHTAEEKSKPLTEAPSGILGLETSLPLGITELVAKGHLTMLQLLEKMSYQPAKMYHLDAGYIKEGGPADLILVDTEAVEEVGESLSRSSNTPFAGWKLQGVVKMTVCAGKVVYEK